MCHIGDIVIDILVQEEQLYGGCIKRTVEHYMRASNSYNATKSLPDISVLFADTKDNWYSLCESRMPSVVLRHCTRVLTVHQNVRSEIILCMKCMTRILELGGLQKS